MSTEKSCLPKVKGLTTRHDSPFYGYDFWRGDKRYAESTGTANADEALKIKAAAIEAAEAIINKVVETGGAPEAPKTFAECCDRWWNDVGAHLPSKKAAGELKLYMAMIMNWKDEKGFYPFGANRLMAEITDDDLMRGRTWRRGHHVKNDPNKPLISDTHVNRSYTEVIRRVFVHARDVLKLHLPKYPDFSKVILGEPEAAPRVLTKAEHMALTEALDEDYDDVRRFALLTGLRKATCLLKWENIDWDGPPRTTFAPGDNPMIIVKGKRGKFNRRKITEPIAQILFKHLGRHEQFVFTFCAGTTRRIVHGERVRHYEQGKRYPITYGGLNTHWYERRKLAAKKAPSLLGIERFCFKSNRSTYGTNVAIASNGNAYEVRDALDHSDIKTSEYYVKVARARLNANHAAAGNMILEMDGPTVGTSVGTLGGTTGS